VVGRYAPRSTPQIDGGDALGWGNQNFPTDIRLAGNVRAGYELRTSDLAKTM
jgi:hypothetical protein